MEVVYRQPVASAGSTTPGKPLDDAGEGDAVVAANGDTDAVVSGEDSAIARDRF